MTYFHKREILTDTLALTMYFLVELNTSETFPDLINE